MVRENRSDALAKREIASPGLERFSTKSQKMEPKEFFYQIASRFRLICQWIRLAGQVPDPVGKDPFEQNLKDLFPALQKKHHSWDLGFDALQGLHQ